jgi:hypothetical protein
MDIKGAQIQFDKFINSNRSRYYYGQLSHAKRSDKSNDFCVYLPLNLL